MRRGLITRSEEERVRGGVVIKGRDEHRGGKEREGICGSAIREENNGNDGS